MGHVIDDGKLASWEEVVDAHDWADLLLGNGLSSHIWPHFRYGSLFERACASRVLTATDRRLFDKTGGTVNFETALAALAVTMRTLEALEEPGTERLRARYLRIQKALGVAVRDVHVPMADLSQLTRETVQETLREHRWVFTTSYDLVLYWCAGYEDFRGFTDYFFCGDRLEFHPGNTIVRDGVTRLVYLHGALHLLVNEKGVTRKRRSRDATLLEQFGTADPDDPLSRPLLVAEGTAGEKARIIQDNEYLSFGLNRLRNTKLGLVIFGLSLRDEDAHLVKALNHRTERPIAVGLRPYSPSRNRRRQANIRKLLDVEQLYFFDATTHPLGAPALACMPHTNGAKPAGGSKRRRAAAVAR